MKGTVHPLSVENRGGFVYCPPEAAENRTPLPVIYGLGESWESFESYLPKLETAFKKGAQPFLFVGVGCVQRQPAGKTGFFAVVCFSKVAGVF